MKLLKLCNECRIRGAKVDGRELDLVESLKHTNETKTLVNHLTRNQSSTFLPQRLMFTVTLTWTIRCHRSRKPALSVSIYLGTVDAKGPRKLGVCTSSGTLASVAGHLAKKKVHFCESEVPGADEVRYDVHCKH